MQHRTNGAIGDNFDPAYIALENGRNEGFSLGHQQGQQVGYNSGHKDGYTEGYTVGHEEGWDSAIAEANKEILKQMEFTRQHVADKETMARQLQEQRMLIDQLTERLDAMERENVNLKKSNEGLREVVTALREANDRLQNEVAQLDDKLRKRTTEYTERVWQYNRNMVFMNAVRSTLEELTAGNGSQAKQVRESFAKKYGEQVSNALHQGTILVAPEKDESLAKTLPKTRKFIVDMLTSVATNAPEHIREQMLAQSQASDEHTMGM